MAQPFQTETMSLLEPLKFVRGSIARKDPVPALTHYSITNGFIKGFNGVICMCAPIALAMDCQPKAVPFFKAVEICEEIEATPALSMTAAGKLTIKAGSFKVHIECTQDDFPAGEPEGARVEIPPGLLEAFRVLAPMIAEDASRPWARGVLLREGSAFATNNCIIGQYWIGFNLGFDMNVPEECIKEILRVKVDPVAVSATPNSITFHYENGNWLKSQLLSTDWPNIAPVLDRPSAPAPVPPDFFDILGRLAPYADANRRVYLRGDTLSTHLEEGIGAVSSLASPIAGKGLYNIDLLRSLDGLVAAIDFSLYPSAALFFGPNTDAGYPVLRGAIVGMKPNGPI